MFVRVRRVRLLRVQFRRLVHLHLRIWLTKG